MRNVATTTLTFLLFASAESLADTTESPKRTLPHSAECATPLPEDFWDDADKDDKYAKDFKSAEEWAWNDRICLGLEADMRDAPGGHGKIEVCTPSLIEKRDVKVPQYRKLRPQFLELILSHELWVSAPRHPQVKLKCALVRGDIDLNNHEIAPAFEFVQGRIEGKFNLIETKFKHSLKLYGTTVTGKLNANHLGVGADLKLSEGGTFSDISLLHAKIAGNVLLNKSTVTGLLNADGLEVGGHLFLRNGVEYNGIDLVGARIAGQVVFNGSIVKGKLNASGLEVGGGLFLRKKGNFAEINLDGARITKSVDFNSSTVSGKLSARLLEVRGDLRLNINGTFKNVDLTGAKIGSNLLLSGSKFSGKFDLTEAAIGGGLRLSSRQRGIPPDWLNGASLVLRNASANVLQARKDSWEMSKGDGFLPTALSGFTFNRLGGLDEDSGADMGDESADWLVDWIEAHVEFGKNYDPQPYTQLAQVLEVAGKTGKANAIRYAKFEHKHDHDTSMSSIRRVLLTLEKIFVGYGVYPFRALYWFFGIVVAGAILAQWSKSPLVRGWMSLWYSLENALPLVETNEDFKTVKHERSWLNHFFQFQKVFGFVLATVLVGALTLLSS